MKPLEDKQEREEVISQKNFTNQKNNRKRKTEDSRQKKKDINSRKINRRGKQKD